MVLARMKALVAVGFMVSVIGLCVTPVRGAEVTIYNISYDASRELYQEIDPAFASAYQKETGDRVTVKDSHAGSGKQARSVLDGGKGDVVTLALAADIDLLANKGHLLPTDWQTRLRDHSAPYTSTIVFLVRKGNPQGIHGWNDLVKPGVSVIAPDPKSSGAARWVYLAAWGQALKANGNDEGKAREYVAAFYRHVPILDSSGRGATTTFAQRSQGDVLVGWENEAYMAKAEFASDQFEVVTPGVSILAEPPVAVVDANAKRDGVEKQAGDFLKFLYTQEAQEIIARHHYRPRDAGVLKEHAAEFPSMQLFTIDDVFGGWKKAQAKHFADKGVFDQIYRRNQG